MLLLILGILNFRKIYNPSPTYLVTNSKSHTQLYAAAVIAAYVNSAYGLLANVVAYRRVLDVFSGVCLFVCLFHCLSTR